MSLISVDYSQFEPRAEGGGGWWKKEQARQRLEEVL